MKVKLYRMSGLPVDMEKFEKYKEEFRSQYDKIWNEHVKEKHDMEDTRKKLQGMETSLTEKYGKFDIVDMPKTGKAWREFMIKYACNVMLGIEEESGKLSLFLLDNQGNEY